MRIFPENLKKKKYISKYLIRKGFQKLVKEIHSLGPLNYKETVGFLFSKKAELIQPWQFKEELMQLAREIEMLKPKTVVEIGTANGGTLFMSTRLSEDDALIVSIDLPGGEFGGGYPEWKVPIYKSFARADQKIELIRGNSHADETFLQLENVLNGRKIDYLFIDGDHTYEGAKMDFEKYRNLVRPGGKVGFHDIVVHKGSECDVYKLWNEVKLEYKHREFVNDWEQNCYGIGIIEKP